ncbi:hypothetical protein JOF41_002410 [Saccharothrix coeruleofusca]|uniref:DUF397 domain-containing protein n=1 Tax=Saccharothrix coeruleofusca TaxID=33919 RepID=UPI001AE8340A|nr:DUF397 domain-containing protein [Saccharothrix coeruleofusca]MBP2336232.1 hypothetical protein [Saccharothrix coeruleofusca]
MTTEWRKSSRSGQSTNCVEVRRTLEEVRDSKNLGGPVLRFTDARAIRAFLTGVRAD